MLAAPGVCSIVASQAGNANYLPAAPMAQSFYVLPADPNADSDGDGIPDPIDVTEGLDPFAKDNDVFGSSRLFVMQQYRDFLTREADAGGLAAWKQALDSTLVTRSQLVGAFLDSGEFRGVLSPVIRLYFAFFQRAPDAAGLQFWSNYYRGGNSLDDISLLFASSAEFAATYGALDNSGFVTLVYRNVLGRDPDPAGLAFWVGHLGSGIVTRGQLMLAFSESPEFRIRMANREFVTMAYVGLLRRTPDPGGFAYWLAFAEAGNPRAVLIGAFIGSPEYRNRFLP